MTLCHLTGGLFKLVIKWFYRHLQITKMIDLNNKTCKQVIEVINKLLSISLYLITSNIMQTRKIIIFEMAQFKFEIRKNQWSQDLLELDHLETSIIHVFEMLIVPKII